MAAVSRPNLEDSKSTIIATKTKGKGMFHAHGAVIQHGRPWEDIWENHN